MFSKHMLFSYLATCHHNNNDINWHIIKFRRFCYYSGSSGWLSLKHVINFCFFKIIGCMVFKAIIDNTWTP